MNGAPPHDLDAERAVLSAVLLDPDAYYRIADRISGDDFFRHVEHGPRHEIIWTACVELATEGVPLDAVTVGGKLKSQGKLADIGGVPYLANITDATPSVANLEAHADIVRMKAKQRRLRVAGQWIAANAWSDDDQVFEQAQSRIFDVCSEMGSKDTAAPIRDCIVTAFQTIQAAAASGNRVTGLPTGLAMLDDLTAGLHGGDLTIVAARPGMGKTSFVLDILRNVASTRWVGEREERHEVVGKAGALFSLEMPKEQIATRMTCSDGRVDVGKVRKGLLSPDDWQRLTQAAGHLSSLPITIDDQAGITMTDLRSRVRRVALQWERQSVALGIVVVDYLQLMRGQGDNREQEIAGIARGLKSLAKDFGVPVIALSQLNRAVESRADKRPMLSDLRESGAIEQDADNVIFLYRDEYYNKDSELRGIAEAIVAKQRNGPTGKVPLRFTASCTRFDSLHPGEVPEGMYE